MSKNVIIVIIIAVIVGGLMFVLVQQYAALKLEPVTEVATLKIPVKSELNEVFLGEMGGATTTQQQDIQDIENIDLGDVKGDFKAVDADISSL